MKRQDNYFVYQDETGKYGYSSESFYKYDEHLLKNLFIVGIKLSEDSAKSISRELNKIK